MATDEAREVAWARHVGTLAVENLDSDDLENARDDFDSGFDAGVVEGIRQAREAVTDPRVEAAYRGWRVAQRGGPLEQGEYEATFSRVEFAWMRAALEAVAAIDALGGEQ